MKGGRGGWRNADNRWQRGEEGFGKCWQWLRKGGGGVWISPFLADIICEQPLNVFPTWIIIFIYLTHLLKYIFFLNGTSDNLFNKKALAFWVHSKRFQHFRRILQNPKLKLMTSFLVVLLLRRIHQALSPLAVLTRSFFFFEFEGSHRKYMYLGAKLCEGKNEKKQKRVLPLLLIHVGQI